MTTIDKKEAFARLREALVDEGGVNPAIYDSLVELVANYGRVAPSRGWLPLGPVVFLEANWPHLDTELLFRSWAAWHGLQFRGVRELYSDLLQTRPDAFFEPRPMPKPIPPRLPLGQTLILLGALTEEGLETALALQKEIQLAVSARVLLGSLLLVHEFIMPGEYYQALTIHFGVPFQGVDLKTAIAIRSSQSNRWCPPPLNR